MEETEEEDDLGGGELVPPEKLAGNVWARSATSFDVGSWDRSVDTSVGLSRNGR